MPAAHFVKVEFILLIDDSRVVTRELPELPFLPGEDQRHCDYLEGGKVVLMQAPVRYINHSCDPNTYVKTLNSNRVVIARREVSAEVEITYDYCINGDGDTVWLCHCRAVRCRHAIHSDFFHLPIELKREYLPLVDASFRKARALELEELERYL